MTTVECIRQRVSCRRFQETPIPREDIRRVVDLARFSPSWKNTQPVRYIVIDDPALKERMARECIPGQGFNTKTINRAAALAVIAYVPGLSGQGDAPLTESQAAGWEMFDAGIAAQTGITTFHTTGRKGSVDSGMRYRKEGVSMGLPSLSEYELWLTDEAEFRACAETVHALGTPGAQA